MYGQRAELTVIGPAMNTLARLEARAKAADLALATSEDLVRLLGGPRAEGLITARIEDGQEPALFALAEREPAPNAPGRAYEDVGGL